MNDRPIRVVGVDLSLTSTGIARLGVAPDGQSISHTTTVGRDGEQSETLRQRWLRIDSLVTEVRGEIGTWPDLVLIEAPAFAAKYGHPHDRSGAWWLLVDHLTDAGITVVEVPPSVVKMWATGRGNAAKPAVTQRVIERWGHLFDIPTGKGRGDVCDAISLATLGAAYLGHHLADLPTEHTRALASVRWPANLTPGDI